jgi:hypothetical protein
MKFSNKGQFNIGVAAKTRGLLGWFKKDKRENTDDHIHGEYSGLISWENSLEISVEEMKILYAECREDSEFTMGQLKKLKDGFMKFETELRHKAKESIPEWIKIVYDSAEFQHDKERELNRKIKKEEAEDEEAKKKSDKKD